MWRRRQGGTVYHLTAEAVSALADLHDQLPIVAEIAERTHAYSRPEGSWDLKNSISNPNSQDGLCNLAGGESHEICQINNDGQFFA